MERISKIKLKLLLSNVIIATIFILYFTSSIKASSSLVELSNSEIKRPTYSTKISSYKTTNTSDIKPESVKLTNFNQIASVYNNERISDSPQRHHSSTIKNRSRTKRQNLPEEFAPLISHQSDRPHYEKLMLLDSNPIDELEFESLASQTTTSSSTPTKQSKGKRTLYACEEKQLQIECQLGESIQLIRANYGRFSIQICNEHGQLDWKVNCMSPASFQIIANSCQAKQSCQLLASNSIFGDSCPGTQKYLEVHYQCVSSNQLANNRTTTGFDGAQSKQQQPPQLQVSSPASPAQNPSQRQNNKNVIQQQQQQATSERNPTLDSTFGRLPAPPGLPSSPQLPTWMVEVPIQPQQPLAPQPSLAARFNSSRPHCPETVWRYLRWPTTEAGQVVQMLCPAYARSSNSLEPYAASFACLQNGQWATRVQAARCQSIWLRNLTKLLEVGDSPLSILSELVRETRPPATPMLVNWPSNMTPATISNSAMVTQTLSLFGDDLIQISRVVRRLVEKMDEFLNRMNDDKQRLAFAREMVQYLVELVNNLAHEHQTEAWLDLTSISGERQRVSGQFVQAIETASGLLAGATSQQHLINGNNQQQQQSQQLDGSSNEDFVKLSENVYVTIRSVPISSNLQNRSIEVSFPSETGSLGFWWMNSQQRFTLHLQAAQPVNSASLEQSQVDVKYPQQQQLEQAGEQFGVQTLRIVFVMIRGIGSQMEPKTSAASDIITNNLGLVNDKQRVIVNSNLVGFSIVADSRFKLVKVDLSAPIELVFRHLFPTYLAATENLATNQRAVRATNPPRCVYWDNNISDWLSDGCRLVATNRTHSTCACNHLTTFALLAEWSSLAIEHDPTTSNQPITPASTSDGGLLLDQAHHNEQQPKLQLDISVENELILPNNKLLYLAKMLNGQLFGSDQQQTMGTGSASEQNATNHRLIIYVSCLISATLLALQLAAAAYNKAHARRLLGAIPAQPPPPLLVSNLRVANSTPSALNSSHHGQPNQTATNCSDQTSPTYSTSDYSVALQASKMKLEQQQQQHQLNDPSGLFPSRFPSVSKRLKQLTFPIHLIVQLFLLELIIVLLVESQNYLERRTRHEHLLNPTWSWQTAQSLQPNFVVSVPPSEQLNPIGSITWLLVLTFYYLIAAITCWLAGQLLKLNVSLVEQQHHLKRLNGSSSPSSLRSSTEASDKSIHYDATNSTAVSSSANPVSASICSQQQQHNSRLPVATNSFYGPSSCYGQYSTNNNQQHHLQQLNNLHSSTSPTSSFSSVGNQSMSDPNTALGRLEVDSTRLYGEAPRFGVSTNLGSAKNQLSGQSLIKLPLDKLYLFVMHVLPVSLVIVIALLSASKIDALNASYFTTNYSFQIAYWPLLVELTSSPLSIIIYYEPAICFILAGFALFLLRSAFKCTTATTQNGGPIGGYAGGKQAPTVVNPYGSSTVNVNNNNSRYFQQQQQISAANNFLGSNNQQQMVLNKQSERQNGLEFGAKWLRMADFSHTNGELKRAKLLCTMLLAILVLHSICWISFLAHIHRSLNTPPPVSTWPQQQQQPWLKLSSNHLTYAFALSNLALITFVSWWQRKTLRRAAQLSGISRFICASSGDRSRKHTGRFYRSHQTSNGGSKVSNGGHVKVSPSSQSLFIVSQQQQQQPQPSYHYGPSYSSGSHQVSQHLYQQLSNQQHIYDSTSAINLVGNEQHHRFNMLIQQQRQQQQQQQRHIHQVHQQDAFTLNRSLQQRQFAQQQLEQRQLMTLKPTSMIQASHSDNGQLLILDANQALKQQQQQGVISCQGGKTTSYLDRSGEAEGPLVAFTSSSVSSGDASNNSSSNSSTSNNQVPVTFGPNSAAHHHRQFQQQQQEHQQHNFQLNSEHQLFSQQNQDQSVITSPTINCISSGSGNSSNGEQQQQQQVTGLSVALTRTSAADANQHQYCSINNPVGGKNYTDALKAALLEQQLQQNESSLLSQHQPPSHFRSRLDATNSQFSIGQTISGAKHNHHQNTNHNNQQQQQQQLALLRHQADTSNIYDVALNH